MVRPLDFAIAVLAISLPVFTAHLPAQDQRRGLRAVDFRNFTYNLGQKGSPSVVLSDGRGRAKDHPETKLVSIRYLDFNADGLEEAIIVLGTGQTGDADYAEDYYVFEYYQERARPLFHEWRERPQGMILDHQSLSIIAPYWRAGDASCCPSAVETVVYRWNGAGFVLAARRLRARDHLD